MLILGYRGEEEAMHREIMAQLAMIYQMTIGKGEKETEEVGSEQKGRDGAPNSKALPSSRIWKSCGQQGGTLIRNKKVETMRWLKLSPVVLEE
jgi:hypothetical protein